MVFPAASFPNEHDTHNFNHPPATIFNLSCYLKAYNQSEGCIFF